MWKLSYSYKEAELDVLCPQNKNLRLILLGVKSRIKGENKNENAVWLI